MTRIIALIFLVVINNNASAEWTALDKGLELGKFKAKQQSKIADSTFTILRINPKYWQLELAGSSWDAKNKNQTVKEWSHSLGYKAAINAGMFATDYKTHIGYMAKANAFNNKHINRYQSVAAFHPKKAGLPKFKIYDLDHEGTDVNTIKANYSSIVQNLRLIKNNGENRWSQQNKKWSEAALGIDANGNALFIFSRTPFSMHDFNKKLLALNIDLVAAQHLEGGPEAQLYYQDKHSEIELYGSFETGFVEDDNNNYSWPIPNVIGIKRRNNKD